MEKREKSSTLEDNRPEPKKEHNTGEIDLKTQIEGLLFASSEPLSVSEIIELIGDESIRFANIKKLLKEIEEEFENRELGAFVLSKLTGNTYQFRTKESLSLIIEPMFLKKPRPLSRAAQETLAIVAYRQPVSRADIEFVRGVDSGNIINNLMERELVACIGRKDIPGKPMLFGTTAFFLKTYGLNNIKDLPNVEAFQPKRELINAADERIRESQMEKNERENFDIGKN